MAVQAHVVVQSPVQAQALVAVAVMPQIPAQAGGRAAVRAQVQKPYSYIYTGPGVDGGERRYIFVKGEDTE